MEGGMCWFIFSIIKFGCRLLDMFEGTNVRLA